MKYIIFLFFVFWAMFSWSQSLTFLYKGMVENTDLGKRESGVSVVLIQNGTTLFSATTASNGKYTLTGDVVYTQPFLIVFSKAGLVSKKVAFDFSRMNEEDIPAGDIYKPMEALDMTLFKERDNADFSFLESEPVASIDWNTRQMSPRLDDAAVAEMKNRILKLIAEADKDKALAEINYQKAITAADGFYNEKKYEEALAKYEEALSYKPAEPYPAERIIELDALIQAQKSAELAEQQENEVYYNLIAEADDLRDQDNLEGAVSKYQEALTKKVEQYPKDQIEALTQMIADRKLEAENQEKYDKAIKEGDSFMKQNSLRAAKDKYTLASKLKPSEQYPIDKLKEIEDKIASQADQEENKKKYTEAVAAADALFDSEDYIEAKVKYGEAVALEDAATYPKERIILCDEKIAEVEAAKNQAELIVKLLKEGGIAITNTEWENAKAKYTEVLGLDDANAEAIERLAFVEGEILIANDLAAQDEKFNQLVADGDNSFSSEEYETALAKYVEATAIKTSSELAGKIANTEAKIKELSELAEQESADQAKKASYDAAIEAGDHAFNNASWDEAIAKYREAMTIDRSSAYPSERISKIEELVAEEKANADKEAEELARKEKYDVAIAEADNLFNSASWDEAIAKYREALVIDDTQVYPVERISKIEELVAEEQSSAELAAAEAAKKANYDAAIAEADNLFNSSSWDEAIAKYREAITIDNAQTYPVEQISKIEELVAEEQSNAELVAAEAAKKASYDAAIAEADNLFNSSNWDEAIAKYREAIAIDDTQSYPVDRISEIEKLVAEQQSEAERLEAEAQKAADIQKLLDEGQAFLINNKLEDAKSKYEEVLVIEDTNAEAIEKINEIKAQLLALQNEADQDASFNELKEEGYRLADNTEYEQAIIKLSEALTIKDDSEVVGKIAEIEAIIADANSNDAEYKAFMEKGDNLMSQKEYIAAIKEYNNALAVKPNEQEPVDKAAEAERLEKAKDQEIDSQYEKIITVAQTKIDEVNYTRAIELLERAKKLRPTDIRPQKMLDEIELLKKQEADYIALMGEGNSLASSKKYEDAIVKFEAANRKKTSATEPAERIEEMRRLITELASADQIAALYAEYMSKGSSSEMSKDYVSALSHYQNALSTKAGDIDAQNKVNEIQQILDDISNANAAELDLQNEFDALVKIADGSFAAQTYIPAKEKYEEALVLKPGNSYVISQIEECVRQEKLLSIAQIDKEYRKVIEVADKNFDSATYDKAKEYYSRALMFRENDPYPKQKLAEIEAILNPVSTQSAQLEDLGDPFDSSIMDGSFILAKAEEERKTIKKVKIEKQLESIQAEETAMLLGKMEDHYSTSNDIYMIYQKITQDAGESELDQQQLAEALRRAKLELENEDAANYKYENAGNIGDQNELYTINEQVALNYSETELSQGEIAEELRKAKLELEINDAESILREQDGSINHQGSLDVITEQVALNYSETELSQGEIAVELRKAKLELEISDAASVLKEQDGNVNHQGSLDDINEQVALNFAETELSQGEIADILRKAKLELETDDAKSILKEQEVNLGDQGALYVINEQVALEYGESEAVYGENADIMNEYNTSHAKARVLEMEDDYISNISSDQELISVKSKFDDGIIERYEERAQVAGEIDEVQDFAKEAHLELASDKREALLSSQGELDLIEESAEEKAKIDSEHALYNAEEIKKGNKELAEAHDGELYDAKEKYIANKGVINEEVKATSKIDEIAKIAHGEKVDYVERMDKKARISDVEGIEGDLEDRMIAENAIHNIYSGVSDDVVAESDKLEQSSAALVELDKTLKAKEAAKSIGAKEKLYDTQAQLNNVDDKPKDKPNIANSLGEEYPEGVSQESFTRSDQDGLVTTIITRRIVVIDGHANVYVRTQSLNGITYSKNGRPSLSSTWNKETQGPHLERHF